MKLKLTDVSVSYGAVKALSAVSVEWGTGERVGVIGPNGAGKTTLLGAISGNAPVSAGAIHKDGTDISGLAPASRARHGLIRSFQTARLIDGETVRDNVLLGRHRFMARRASAEILGTPEARRRQRESFDVADDILDLCGLTGHRDVLVDDLPYGTRRIVEVARVLAAGPDVILLDEPAAGLDPGARRHLADLLVRVHDPERQLLILVEHDVELVTAVCTTSIVLDAGSMIAAGNPSAVLELPHVRAAYFGG